MFNHHFTIMLYKEAVALVCAASLSMSSPTQANVTAPLKLTQPQSVRNVSAQAQMWDYLREGINYLEASGKEIPTYIMHAGGKAYGPLALSPIAIKDVKNHYPRLSGLKTEEVLLDKDLYERFAFLYADLLLKHYLKLDYQRMDKKEVFVILEKAWFLGPSLYLRGHPVIASREIKAEKYVNKRIKPRSRSSS